MARYLDIDYQARILNRLARRARRKDYPAMVDSLNRAQWKIWAILDSIYDTGRPLETTAAGHAMRRTI